MSIYDWYMVSYVSAANGKTRVNIPLRMTPAGGDYLIDYITH